MAVTIRDVAKAAGVSASTVSRALANPDVVDPSTRERVTRVADSLGYRPNRAAQGLITGRTGNLGLILPDLANPFFPSVVKAIQQRAHESDYQVFVADTDEVPQAELGLVRSLAKQVDGVILCSPRMKPAELREASSYVPVVLANRHAGSISSVTVDSPGGMRSLVDHLVGLGHRQIGYVAGPRSSWSSRERLSGLRAATAASGAVLVELGHFRPTFEGGQDSADGVIAALVTAVVAYNDLCAIGLISALRDRAVSVPTEVSVVGIDDIEMSAMLHPALTTLRVPKHDLGRTAVELLLHALGEPASRPRHAALTTQLVIRGTTAPPAVSVESTAARPASRPRPPELVGP